MLNINFFKHGMFNVELKYIQYINKQGMEILLGPWDLIKKNNNSVLDLLR